MKYKAGELSNGKYAVFVNKGEYFVSTVVDTMQEAEILALEHSARWYQKQIDSAWLEWVKKQEAVDASILQEKWSNVLA
jgi:hypothetical protein